MGLGISCGEPRVGRQSRSGPHCERAVRTEGEGLKWVGLVMTRAITSGGVTSTGSLYSGTTSLTDTSLELTAFACFTVERTELSFIIS